MAKSTACRTSEQIDFHLDNGNRATADFSGGDISGLGGLIFPALVEGAYGLIEGAARCIKDKRNPRQVTHAMENLLRQAVLLCAAGYPDEIDSNHLRIDPMLKFCLGWKPNGEQHASSQPSQSRLMTERTHRDLLRLFSFFISFYIQKHSSPPEFIILDLDGSAIEAHGRQQFIAFNGHYEVNMYFPLFVLDGDGWLIAPILRPGNVSDAGIAVDVLKLIVKRFRRAWPEVQVLFRGDAAFHDPKIMDWCEENGVEYVTGLKSDTHLNTHSMRTDKAAEKKFVQTFGPPRFVGSDGSTRRHANLRKISAMQKADRRNEYQQLDSRQVRKLGEFKHRVGDGFGGKYKKWKKERRVISLARFTDRGLKRRYLVTSLEKTQCSKEEIYDEIYSGRGNAELVIRAMKSLGTSRMNNHEAHSNQFKLIVQGLAYNLLKLVRQSLPKQLQRMSAETIVREIIRIPVQVKVSTRRVWMRWSSSYAHQKEIRRLCKRLNQLPKPS